MLRRVAFSFRRLTCPSNPLDLRSRHTLGMCFSSGSPAKEFKVVLDNGTLYVGQELAEATLYVGQELAGMGLGQEGKRPTDN